jgi:chloride channel protein, CIC family
VPDGFARWSGPARVAVFGLAGGLGSVVFLLATNWVFKIGLGKLAAAGWKVFLPGSLAVIMAAGLLSGWLLGSFFPTAAGSGIPQLKAAYWNDLGYLPWRAVWVKFVAGVISLGGGFSLGREGPSVYLAGGCASQVAGLLGASRQKRRLAAVAGAAAGLAAAFNTPLAAITFALEEVIGDLNSRLLGATVLAAVLGAFTIHGLVGPQPAFSVPDVTPSSLAVFLLVPVVAALAAVVGAVFQREALSLRARVRALRRVPVFLRPVVGGLLTWALGVGAYLATGRAGVFGLGYDDLSEALVHGLPWTVAGVLLAAKLPATVASYGWGGCGGIFSPMLFLGGMTGLLVGGVAAPWLGIGDADLVVLAVVGMSSCLGAVVRAPLTSILIVFEMTHQFGLVPALLLGTLVSQAVARALLGRHNFYDALLKQDGQELSRMRPKADLEGWHIRPVSDFATVSPATIRDLAPPALAAFLGVYPYNAFPVELEGRYVGLLTRSAVRSALAQGAPPIPEPAPGCRPDTPLREAARQMVDHSSGMIAVFDERGGVAAILTLHDLIRAQAALTDA